MSDVQLAYPGSSLTVTTRPDMAYMYLSQGWVYVGTAPPPDPKTDVITRDELTVELQGVISPAVLAGVIALAQSDAGLQRGTTGDPQAVLTAAGGIADANGRLSDVQWDTTGKITQPVIDAWRARMSIPPNAFTTIDSDDGSPFGVRAPDGSKSDLWLAPDGGLADHAIARIASRLGIADNAEAARIAVVGDSYSTYTPYQNAIATATGCSIYTGTAKGGRTSTEIAVTFGGISPQFTVAGASVPAATTAVALTLVAPANDWNAAYAGSAPVPWTYHGALYVGTTAILGTLTQDPRNPIVEPARWQFARDSAGSAVTASGTVTFVCDDAAGHHNDIVVLWPGRNSVYSYNALVEVAATQNLTPEVDSRQFIQRSVQSMIGRIPAMPRKRFLILGVVNTPLQAQEWLAGTAANQYKIIRDYNARMGQLYGPQFFDVRRWLIDNATSIAAAAGITLTGNDTTDISNDVTPRSFFQDSLHLANAVYTAVGTETGLRLGRLGLLAPAAT